MRVVTKDFLNENAYRNYPVDDAATMEPYSGPALERVSSLLVDLAMCIPKAAAACAFVSSISVTDRLVTVTIMGSATHPFMQGSPAVSLHSADYAALGAVVLARVQVLRDEGLPGTVVPLIPVEPGVGGWVVFGPGILEPGSWHFADASASMLSDRCVTRLDRSGVLSIGRQGFDTALDGAVLLEGRQGLEIIQAGASELRLQFSGDATTVRRNLAQFVGACGGRPEAGSCGGEPVRRINGVYPAGPDSEIVVVLDRPFYATLAGAGDAQSLQVSSDIPLERFCAGRPKPPSGCESSGVRSALSSDSGTSDVQPPSLGTAVFFEACGPSSCASGVFTYVSQKAGRPGVAVFESPTPVSALGEMFTRLEVDQVSKEWQMYSGQGASLLAYGPVDSNFRSSRAVEYLASRHLLELGLPTSYDLQGVSQLLVTVDAADAFPFAGTYDRVGYRRYVLATDGSYELQLRGSPDSSWAILRAGKVLAAGPIQPDGIGTQVQQYVGPSGESSIRTVGVSAVPS
jgi:hypothetical protein